MQIVVFVLVLILVAVVSHRRRANNLQSNNICFDYKKENKMTLWYIFSRLEVSPILGADFRALFIPLLTYSYTQESRKAGVGTPFIIDAASKLPIELIVPSAAVSIPSNGL